MSIDVILKEDACKTIVANIYSINGEIGNSCPTDEQTADNTAGGKQRRFSEELCHNAPPFHTNGGKNTNLASPFKHSHHQRVCNHCRRNTQNDEINDDEKRIGIIFKLNHELILITPGEDLVVIGLQCLGHCICLIAILQ